uniref:Ankyrin repeat and LEM domain containing 2 n=1 Tax=Mastacembelus armatus TaxID=205130 RepID=A0A7N8YG43_9TELE
MMKGARFKAFPNREDAEKFAKGICDYFPSPSKSTPCVSPVKPGLVINKDNMEVDTINRERANSFKSPRTQDLTAKLRKAVEKGDKEAFSELVWSNPRYLIGSGDNPTIVQEGCRYNVMHVAAKENQAGIAQLLLDTLENPEFMRLMYPDDQEVMLQKRIRYIVDLYLNTPDKAGFETPLHFACKFGCPDVVNVLCSHPDIDKNCKNKDGQKPTDLICSRKNKTQEVKQKICDYLEDRCYIPLLRAADNTSQPIIGAPWSPESSESLSLFQQHTKNPMDPVMTVSAFAGPLSPSKADDFRRCWKTPPRDRANIFHHILKSDPERGAERVGRDLAHEMGHPWAEYWDFLECFVDLSSSEGLRKLEEYLGKKDFSPRAHEEAGENETSNRFKTPSPGKPKKFCNSISVGAFLDEGDDISLEEMKNRQNAALTSITSSDLLCCCDDGLLSPGVVCKNGVCSSSRDRTHNGDKVSPRTSPSSSLGGADTGTSATPTVRMVRLWMGQGGDRKEEGQRSGAVAAAQRSTLKQRRVLRCWAGLGGQDSPTRLDKEVLSAIQSIDIDPQKYPSIHKWKSTMTLYSASDMQSWPSPAVLKPRLRTQHQTPGSPVSSLMSPTSRFSPAWHTASPDFSPSRYSPANASYIQRIRLKHLNEPPV